MIGKGEASSCTIQTKTPAHLTLYLPMKNEPETLEKRTWVYVQEPSDYGIPPHSCGMVCQWSEFKHHLWCPKCEVDFIPENSGVFDGPILANVAGLLGMSFDRINLETQQVEKFEDYINRADNS